MNTQTPTRPSFWSTVGIVAKREIVVRCMSKSFIVSTLITLAVMFLAVVFTPQIGKWMDGGATTVATTAADPPISEIMFSMLAAGLIEIPPVSNVIPLPTSDTCFFASAG